VSFSGASNTASARLLWDANNLYVAYQVADTRLQAVQTARDAADLWLDDAVEVYVDTANAGADTMQPHDYQLLLNLRNVQGDLRGTGSGKDASWNATWRSAVALAGTLNNDGNTDQGYAVEIAIPWAQVGVTPAFGRVFGMDLAVDDRDAGGTPPFDYFDWAGIAPGNYAQPRLWRKIRLSPAVVHPPVANLVATRPAGTVTIDGLLGDWTGATPVQFAGPSNTVTARVMWDAVNLYAALQVTDTRLAAVQTARDAPALWKDDTVELYLDSVYGRAASMQPHDYQLLVNAAGIQGDLRGTGAGKDPAWNAVWRSAVVRQGTLNNHGDTDGGYVVEVAIPWTVIGVLPLSGSYLGMDLAVDDSDPGAARAFSYFDWAGIAPGSYAQPLRWRTVLLSP
jgi:cellulose/xylan binding protein with CBM9 domain